MPNSCIRRPLLFWDLQLNKATLMWFCILIGWHDLVRRCTLATFLYVLFCKRCPDVPAFQPHLYKLCRPPPEKLIFKQLLLQFYFLGHYSSFLAICEGWKMSSGKPFALQLFTTHFKSFSDRCLHIISTIKNHRRISKNTTSVYLNQ